MSWFNGRHVIVPFDFSDECVKAVTMALKLAERPDEVHVAHVLLRLPANDPLVIWNEFNEEERLTKVREAIEHRLAAAGVVGVRIDVAVGTPGRTIADLAEEIGAGLIVIPSHGYTGIKRWLLGSVAGSVVQLARCPVLVLKNDVAHDSDAVEIEQPTSAT